ncbi:MAG: ParA family protein [Desulfovibrio sp.]|nr:ParA family protein [Desulfovibrio sp.]
MAVYAVSTIKGGEAKTTVATALATAPSWPGHRLLVELDPQGDCALILGMQADPALPGRRKAFGEALAGGRRPLVEALGYLPDGTTGYLSVDASVYVVQDPLALRRALDSIRWTCTVVIDLPPQETSVALLGMCAADAIIVPATEDELGLAGLARTVRFFTETVQKRVPEVRIAGVVPVRVRTGLKQQTPQLEASRSKMRQLAKALGLRILPGIRERQAVRSAQDAHETIWAHPAAVDTRADMYALINALQAEGKRHGKESS